MDVLGNYAITKLGTATLEKERHNEFAGCLMLNAAYHFFCDD
jgi:hypothetical protein